MEDAAAVTVKLADKLLDKADAFCNGLSEAGFGDAAGMIQTRLWKSYDDLLALTAKKNLSGPEVIGVMDDITGSIQILEDMAKVAGAYGVLMAKLGQPQ